MKTQQTSFASLLAVILFAIGSAPTLALDTDVYLKAQSVVRNDVPNVLIILDNSGSMTDSVPSTRPAYDPTVNYCTDDLDTKLGMYGSNAGKPNNCGNIAGRIFFSFNGNPPSYTTSTTSGSWFADTSGSWFDDTKNKCIDSGTAFSSAGRYSSAKIASWKSGNNWKSLNSQINSDMTYVDCNADGTTNGLSAGDPQFPRSSTSSAYTNTSGQAFVWTSFSTNAYPTLYSSNYMNYWYNTNLDTSRSKINIAKDAVDDVINSNKNIRFGLMVFNHNTNSDSTDTGNHGGRVIFKTNDMTDARRAAMVSTVNSILAETYTPLAETMWEAYRYYSAKSVDYGDNDPAFTPLRDTTAESGGNYITPFTFACQKSYIILVTDGDPTNDTNANTKIHGMTGNTLAGNSTCGNSSGSSCLANLTYYMHNNDIVSTLTGSQTVTTYTVGFGVGISASGLALLQNAATQGGGTYTSATDADQLASALQGYLTQILTETTSFTAPSLSINAFNKQYNNNDVYLSVFKPENGVAWDGNVKKYKLCTGADITAGRCAVLSDILDADNKKITDINNNIIDGARSFWSVSSDGSTVNAGGAGAVIPVPASRHMYTYYESGGPGYSGLTTPSTGIEIKVDINNNFYKAVKADPTLLGLPNTAVIPTDVDSLVNWMRGNDSYNKHGGGNRWAFGDPLHSRSVPITYGIDGSGNPIIKLFVGANDGTIRMINNDNSSGVEEWSFIPQEAYGIQYQLSQEADADHIYGMDGTPNFWVKDINNDGIIDPVAGDRVYMYIGMRRGGRNIYAFDVTPSATLTNQTASFTPKLMWVIKGGSGNFTQLGQTWSQPRVARIAYKCPTPVTGSVCDNNNPNKDDGRSRVVLMFAGGYDTNQDNAIPAGTDTMGNAIYMVDPLTGSLIWWASNNASASLKPSLSADLSKMKYGIPSDMTLVDTDGDGRTDRLYVGDMGGQIWRIDFDQKDFTATNNGTTAAYVFADMGCNGDLRSNNCTATTAQNQRKFFYPPAFAPVRDTAYSTNPNYDLIVIGSGDREDPLDLLTSNLVAPKSKEAVHNRIYALRDFNYKTGAPSTTPTTLNDDPATTPAILYDATANNLSTMTGVALQTEIDTLKNSKGWYIDLINSVAITVPNGGTTKWIGEKVLAPAKILDGILLMTTFTPANDTSATSTCSANEGVAKEWVLNPLNALGLGDFNKNGTLTRSGQIGGGIPSEVVVVFRPDGATGLINAGGKGGAPTGAVGIPQNGASRNYWNEE
jgi:type IV pilus assembly protein PilY1